ncbi:MAG: 2-oxoacid:acceptor oxidoreductase family protein [Negativicutes bacterium]|nr:2-oxoacid:acceptor oxidoreductase family protein [Negativicutes bacterium]
MIEIRWHGRGGQGAFTAARLLGLAASVYEGKQAQAFPSFGPERRGAPVLAFTRIDDRKILDRSEVENCSYAVVLDETLLGPNVESGLLPGSTIIVNSAHSLTPRGDYKIVTIDATSLALAVLGKPITNIPMLGALVAASSLITLDSAFKAIDDQMQPALRAKSKQLLQQAYDAVRGAE